MSNNTFDKASILGLYTKVLRRYLDFNGRTRRKEFWTFTLMNVIISVVLSILSVILALIPGIGSILYLIISLVSGLFGLAILLPFIAVTVRRLQDINKDWYWIFLNFVPIANFYLIYLLAQDSQVGDNRFGSDPKAAERQGMQTPPSF